MGANEDRPKREPTYAELEAKVERVVTVRIKEIRRVNRWSNQRLRRARRLYVYLHRETLRGPFKVRYLHHMALMARNHELYSSGASMHDTKFSILRILWKLETGGPKHTTGVGNWWDWMHEHGWWATLGRREGWKSAA